MADIFVDSAAGGANNGTDWTNAYLSIASTVGASAGDVIKVDDGHAEAPGAATTWNWSNGTVTNPVLIVCVDKTNSDALSTGALIGNTTAHNLILQGNIYARGIGWRSGAALTLSGNTDNVQVHENCTLVLTGSASVAFHGGSARTSTRLVNTNIDLSGTTAVGVALSFGHLGVFSMIGGTVTLRATQTNLIAATTNSGISTLEGVTCSGTCTNLAAIGSAAHQIRLIECALPTYTNVTTGAPAGEYTSVTVERCAVGTITDPALGLVKHERRSGIITETLAKYRTGGASDGEQANAVSWEMVSDADALEFTTPLISPWMSRWVSSGASQDVTIYVAGAASMNNDDVWIEVLSPSEEVSPTAASVYRTTRMAALGTPAALTTDAVSTWNGSDVGTKQEMTVTISPTIAGVVRVRVCLAKPSTTVNVDPLVGVA